MTRDFVSSSKSLQKELDKWAKKLAKSAGARAVEKAKTNAPKHLKRYIYGKSSPKAGFRLGVQKVEIFGRKRGDIVNRGSMDAAAQEFGSGIRATDFSNLRYIVITPRIKTKKSGGVIAKYSKFAKKSKVRGIMYQRAWLTFPNTKNASGSNVSKDGNKIFARAVYRHPGIFPYRGRGYLRVSVDEVFTELESSLPQEILDIVLKHFKISLFPGVLSGQVTWKTRKD